MRHLVANIGITIGTIVMIGCGENGQVPVPGPNMQAVAPVSSGVTCDFKGMSQTANRYFSGTEAKVVRTIITAMQTAGAFTTAAQNDGFDIMVHIAANITAGNTDATDASTLTNQLLACMYNNPADLPATFPEDFTTPANPALHGAYAVRGGPTDPDTAVVFSRPFTSSFTGIAPPVGSTWPGILGGNPAPHRILVYGLPGSSSTTYDWRVVPRSTTFSPAAIVGVCVDPFAETTDLLHEQNIGLLPFINALFMDLSSCSPVASAPTNSAAEFAHRAIRKGFDLFGPAPLSASPLFIDGLGGTTGSIHSEFGSEKVDTVTLTFFVQPTDVQVNQIITPPVVVQATHASTGSTVSNVSITMSSFNNNGTPAFLGGTLTQVTNSQGLATFADLFETKTGGYLLQASGTVGGRPAIFVLQATSTRFNVRP